MDDTPLSGLPGIGLVTQERLREASIMTAEDLRRLGAVEAYRRIKFMLPNRVTLNALYGLEAALRGCRWLDLPDDVKEILRREAAIIDEHLRRGASARCSGR